MMCGHVQLALDKCGLNREKGVRILLATQVALLRNTLGWQPANVLPAVQHPLPELVRRPRLRQLAGGDNDGVQSERGLVRWSMLRPVPFRTERAGAAGAAQAACAPSGRRRCPTMPAIAASASPTRAKLPGSGISMMGVDMAV